MEKEDKIIKEFDQKTFYDYSKIKQLKQKVNGKGKSKVTEPSRTKRFVLLVASM